MSGLGLGLGQAQGQGQTARSAPGARERESAAEYEHGNADAHDGADTACATPARSSSLVGVARPATATPAPTPRPSAARSTGRLALSAVGVAAMSQGLAFLMGALGLGLWKAPASPGEARAVEHVAPGGVSGWMEMRGGAQNVLVWVVGMVVLCLVGGYRWRPT